MTPGTPAGTGTDPARRAGPPRGRRGRDCGPRPEASPGPRCPQAPGSPQDRARVTPPGHRRHPRPRAASRHRRDVTAPSPAAAASPRPAGVRVPASSALPPLMSLPVPRRASPVPSPPPIPRYLRGSALTAPTRTAATSLGSPLPAGCPPSAPIGPLGDT